MKYSRTTTYFAKCLELWSHVRDTGESISRHDMCETCTPHAPSDNIDPLSGTNIHERRGCDTSRIVPSGYVDTVKTADRDDQWFKSLLEWNRTLEYVMLHFEGDKSGCRVRTIAQLMA